MANPEWKEFSIQLPGNDLLEGARNALETLMVFLEILKAILETVKLFLIDFGNPIRAIVEALIGLIIDLFESLKRTGLFGYYDIPNPLDDPNFENNKGGYTAFTNRFIASLGDTRDPNRPQPAAGFTQSGFTLIVADAEGPIELMRLIKILMGFFGKEFLQPKYAPPANVKVLPLGDSGDPVLNIVDLFQEKPEDLVVSWALPPSGRPGDPGFSDIVESFSTDFFPPKWLIEKSSLDVTGEVDIKSVNDAGAVGRVTAVVETEFELRGIPGDTIETKIKLNDEYNDPFIRFEEYIVIDATNESATFFLGQLGTFRYIDTDVEPGKTYYYRVRAFSGDLPVTDKGQLALKISEDVVDRRKMVVWPGEVTMGQASAVIRVRLPEFVEDFDVIEVLQRTFQVAYSLNFHQLQDPEAKFIAQPTGPRSQAQIASGGQAGAPIPPTEPSQVGVGEIDDLAGVLASAKFIPIVGALIPDSFGTPDPVTGLGRELPWQTKGILLNSTRIANLVAGSLLEAGSGPESMKDFFELPLPKGPVGVTPANETLAAQTNLKDLVFKITEVQPPEVTVTTAGRGQRTTRTTAPIDLAATQAAARLYADAFEDVDVRLNMVAAISFFRRFTLGGTPPDWVSISVFRDIIPWGAQLLYELLAKMQALLDAFSGVIDEIKAFIDLLIRKINTLERFLEYLISILDFIAKLSVGFFILSVPSTGGDTGEWARLIDNAGGTPPSSGPGGYSGGVGLAYVAIDVSAFTAAFSLLF